MFDIFAFIYILLLLLSSPMVQMIYSVFLRRELEPLSECLPFNDFRSFTRLVLCALPPWFPLTLDLMLTLFLFDACGFASCVCVWVYYFIYHIIVVSVYSITSLCVSSTFSCPLFDVAISCFYSNVAININWCIYR